jgi:serine/threonine protein kinase
VNVAGAAGRTRSVTASLTDSSDRPCDSIAPVTPGKRRSAAPPTLPLPGAVLANKYRLDRVLGEGGMGVVYDGQHLILGQRVAIKFLRPEQANDESAIARFLHEARAAATLRGQQAVRILDIDTSAEGAPYIVMERLHGTALDVLLDREKRLPVALAVDYVLQACEALAEAHAAGIVHRDIKPANLFLTARSDGAPLVKVLDFGISKTLDAEVQGRAALTGPGVSLGSPEYMSPEQVRNSGTVDARTDIWSLGIMLYELTTGRVPFEGESVPHLFSVIMSAAPVPLTQVRSDVPPGLEEVIQQCLVREVDARIPDVGALATRLAPFGSTGALEAAARVQRTLEAPPRVEERSMPALMTASPGEGRDGLALTMTAYDSRPRDERARRVTRALAVAGVLVLVAAVGVLARRAAPAPPSVAPPVAAFVAPGGESVSLPPAPSTPSTITAEAVPTAAAAAAAPATAPPPSASSSLRAPLPSSSAGSPSRPLQGRSVVRAEGTAPKARTASGVGLIP